MAYLDVLLTDAHAASACNQKDRGYRLSTRRVHSSAKLLKPLPNSRLPSFFNSMNPLWRVGLGCTAPASFPLPLVW